MWRQLILCLLATLLVACRPAPLQEQQAYVFGTRVEVLVVGSEPAVARQAIGAVLREFDRLHRTYHAWETSDLTRLNQALAQGKSLTVDGEMARFISEAQALSAQGDHLFDPGIGALIQLWGFHNDSFKAELPAASAIAQWLKAKPSIADLRIDGARIQSKNRAVALDFGGYLKGVALDRAAAILREQGIRNALINIGGNVMALGDKDGRKWRVGIQHPRASGALAILELNDGEAVGTSGDYQRYFELEGRRYSHLIDPRNGQPVSHTEAVTLLVTAGPRAGTLSDACSKPIFIAGPEQWREMARRQGIEHVLRVDGDGRIQATAAMLERMQFPGTPPEIARIP